MLGIVYGGANLENIHLVAKQGLLGCLIIHRQSKVGSVVLLHAFPRNHGSCPAIAIFSILKYPLTLCLSLSS